MAVFGLLLTALAPAVRADLIYQTDGPGTGFPGSGLILTQSSGTAATLSFTGNGPTDVNPPSNINYGFFQLSCPGCTTAAGGVGAWFDPFEFNLEVRVDGTNYGSFHMQSDGGWIYLNQSTISVSWMPMQLGPGAAGLDQGSFGPYYFVQPTLAGIVAPNSGTLPGVSTIQGRVGLDATAVPEPLNSGWLEAGSAALLLLIAGQRAALKRSERSPR
jgi:hypothetical protein